MAGKRQIIKYQVQNLVRSRWLIAYTLFFLVSTDSMIRFLGPDTKTLLSLMNIVITVVPLVSLVFGGIYFYNSKEFVELLASQPIRRSTIFSALYLSTGGALGLCVGVGMIIPFVVHHLLSNPVGWLLLLLAAALTFIFTSLALWITVRTNDKAKGIGIAIILWLGMAVLYDGIILLIVYYFSDYPLDMMIAAVTILNPVDLARISVMMQLDVSALMGYTGAVFDKLLRGNSWVLIFIIGFWLAIPYFRGRRVFLKKDL